MEDLPSLTTNRKLKEEVESWIMEQDEKKSAAEAAEQFPDLKNYASRSVIKIVGNASKAAEKIRDAMTGKRSASMMEAARSGAVLAKKQATDIDRDIISPPINTRKSATILQFFWLCQAFTHIHHCRPGNDHSVSF